MFIDQLSKDPAYFFATIIAVVVSVCFHELAHGLVAIRLGDQTPLERGHITLNPLVHMGWMSLIMMCLTGIAWGAMPVDRRRLRGKYGAALVSAAGPATNVLIAAITLTALGLWMRIDDRSSLEMSSMAANGRLLLWVFGATNVLLALFNLIPVPPLDGSGILRGLVPAYGEVIDKIRSPQFVLIAVLAAGWFISPMAVKIASSCLIAIRGW